MPPRLTTWLKALELTRKGAIDELVRQPSGRTFLPVAALAPVMVGNEVLARLSPALTAASYDPDDESFDFHQTIMSWGISPFSLKLLDRVQWAFIPERRRENYRQLSQALGDVEGCRYCDRSCRTIPVRSFCRCWCHGEGRSRATWSGTGSTRQSGGIKSIQRSAGEEFPEAVVLKDTVLALPVHQDLNPGQLDYLANILRRCPALGPRGD